MLSQRRCLSLGLCLVGAFGCSNFMMENDFHISVRTMDLGAFDGEWVLTTRPHGSAALRNGNFGYVSVVEKRGSEVQESIVAAGINMAGLTCDMHVLLGSEYPSRNESLDNIDAGSICQWALEGFDSVRSVKAALPAVNFVEPAIQVLKNLHWIFRDSHGEGLVIEFLSGRREVYDDNNDGGLTGFGVCTNEPPFMWQLQGVRHLQWKQSLARSAVEMPSSWYPDARFQRLHLVKSGMPKPETYEVAMMQALHTLNTVTVPMGQQLGTDSGVGEGLGDHTQFAVVYDHRQQILYWRTEANQNLQRLRLADAALEDGNEMQVIALESASLPWFNDASTQLSPMGGHMKRAPAVSIMA